MLWTRQPRLHHFHLVLPAGERTTLISDIAIGHHLQLPIAHHIVDDVLRYHADMARAGRLIAVQLPLALPITYLPTKGQ